MSRMQVSMRLVVDEIVVDFVYWNVFVVAIFGAEEIAELLFESV